jgi:alpha-glucosidase
MLGESLLVAPVVEKGARQRKVYLPKLAPGQYWFDFETREAFESGQTYIVEAALEKLPLFVIQGAEIPLASPRPGQIAHHDDPVTERRQF